MTITTDGIERWNLTTLDTVFEIATERSARKADFGATLDAAGNGLKDWEGKGGDAFRQELGKHRVDITDQQVEATAIANAFTYARSEVAACKNEWGTLKSIAAGNHWSISSTGQLSGQITDRSRADFDTLQRRLTKLMSEADRTDRDLATAIRAVVGDTKLTPAGRELPQSPVDEQDTDDPVPGPDEKPGDPGYPVPHAPGDPADYPSESGWKSDAQPMVNPPGYPPMPPGAQRDQNWSDYLSGKNADGTMRAAGVPPAAYPRPEAVQDKGLKIVGAAENQQGTRYVWGGGNQNGTTSPGTRDGGLGDRRHDYEHTGFDCSGLSEYAIYQATGYDPGKGTWTQFHNWTTDGAGQVLQTGQTLDASTLKPGDVIYYDGSSGVAGQHVAIYMGNGVSVETSESGTPVHSQAVTPSMSGGSVRVVRPNP